MILNTHYAYGAGVSGAVIIVTAPTGSTVTATLEGTVYTSQEVNGTWTFKVRKFGTYTINATLGNQTASTTVTVTEAMTYEVTLTYTLSVSISGTLDVNFSNCYVIINNVYYGNLNHRLSHFPANINITPGTEIQVGMAGYGTPSSTPSTCTINGQTVISNKSERLIKYTFTPTRNCTIVMKYFLYITIYFIQIFSISKDL